MMVNLSKEYYNLEKVAEVLSVPTAEVNRLREQSKLRGFRDGTDWKFLKEDVHSYLADTIKARSIGNGHKPGDSDFDILSNDVSASSFDLLVENAPPLPNDDQLVAVTPTTRPVSDLDLAALDNDDELSLAEETRISSVVMPQKAKMPEEIGHGVAQDDDDSDALLLASASKSYAVSLDDNESVLGAGGSSPQLGLAGDSGFDVLIAGEDSDLLEVDEEKTAPVFATVEEFVLEPSVKMSDVDDSESSSQVIAVDAGFVDTVQDADPFGQTDFSASEFDFGGGPQSATGTNADPFTGGDAPFSGAFTAPVTSTSSKKAAVPTEEYSTETLIGLIAVLVVMLLPGLMLIDTMVHMWSWNEPFILNSILMNTISGWFGL